MVIPQEKCRNRRLSSTGIIETFKMSRALETAANKFKLLSIYYCEMKMS